MSNFKSYIVKTHLGWAAVALVIATVATLTGFQAATPWFLVMPIIVGLIRTCIRFFTLLGSKDSGEGLLAGIRFCGRVFACFFRSMRPLFRPISALVALTFVEQLVELPPQVVYAVAYIAIAAIPFSSKKRESEAAA